MEEGTIKPVPVPVCNFTIIYWRLVAQLTKLTPGTSPRELFSHSMSLSWCHLLSEHMQ